MGYYQINLYTQHFQDWHRSFEILSSFLEASKQGWIKGYSFNRYSGDRPRAQLRVRFNFVDDDKGKERIEKIIDDMVSKDMIIGKDEWRNFIHSHSVIRATETATKCAFSFKNWMDRNPQAFKYYAQSVESRIRFMARYLMILLQQLEFRTYLEEYPIGPNFMELIRDCATYCADEIRDDFQHDLDITFLERFIHHFLNCIFVNLQEEARIYDRIRHWNWLGELLLTRC